MTVSLSRAEARRIAIAAQGLADRRPAGEPGRAHLKRVFERVGLIQIDSVNAVARSHYLPPFARLGAYPQTLLEEAAWGRKKQLFEYWGHEASLIPVELQPLFRWRMARAEAGEGTWGNVARFGAERRDFIEAVAREIESRGPIAAGDLSEGGKAAGAWWGWSDGKRAMEWLFWSGRITTATRRGFERVYDLTERVLPAGVASAPTPAPADAQRELIRIAARAMGVATEGDLRDYFRMDVADARARIAELVEAGELEPASVQGWGRPAFLAPDARRPRKVAGSALLSPFDSLVWRRERAERLFDFRYRLEIYTPAEKRTHGYYVLPWLQGDRIPARLDLKSDRAAGLLRVKAAHAEEGVNPDAVAPALAADLSAMARWLGLKDVALDGGEPLDEALRRTPFE
ncbi:winged helix-turn-helix domain-containing protein [Caulobacter sp. 17J80-11]|uniref:winged helix-turn-helix domain-containing protein n=1 Tax=Caulobacter sp. 17J80-11 TaxID=2763502 RepID=UPI0016537E5F|nr:winged helix-turn-helix domain-containing protein [Caulobacter sp. 17J80-11]MBC6982223.1 YcaQ family DNA glycosylase [Caulobacter sp. 17J80-11]